MAAGTITSVASTFYRHASLGWPSLQGSETGGRWGPPRSFPVLYLGRPSDSVIVEAYRHLVDGIEGMRADLVAPRRFVTAEVNVTKILDLRDKPTLLRVGLSLESIQGPHAPCQRVAQVAHQLGLHGILAPAATALGETLALFERHLPTVELPVLIEEQIWQHLPTDPRQLHIVDGGVA